MSLRHEDLRECGPGHRRGEAEHVRDVAEDEDPVQHLQGQTLNTLNTPQLRVIRRHGLWSSYMDNVGVVLNIYIMTNLILPYSRILNVLTYQVTSQPVFCLYLEHTRSAELVLTDNHKKEKDDN